MSIEAMKQALEALEEACGDRCNAEYNPCHARTAITSLRQAIEQAEKNEHPMRALLKQAFGQPSEIPKIGCVNHDCDKCQAIEQAEKQEPVATLIEHLAFTDGIIRFYGVENMEQLPVGTEFYTTPQPQQDKKQEPVALKRRLVKIHDALSNHIGDTDPYIDDDMTDEEICESEPVFWAAKEIADLIGDAPWTEYTTPQPQRQWVGLTDEEVADLGRHELWIKQFIRIVEAKLKERNHVN